MQILVDVDDYSTWPVAIRDLIAELDALTDTEHYASDLRPSPDADRRFVSALAGGTLLVRHCTRLLPHERQAMRRTGLRNASPEALLDRLVAAREHGYLSGVDLQALVADVTDDRSWRHRNGQVCVILGRAAFARSASVQPLLSNWGGEAFYRLHRLALDYVTTASTPATVCIALDVTAQGAHLFSPGVAKVFLGVLRGSADAAADVFYRADVPRTAILTIAMPGDAEFDRLTSVP